MTQFLDFDFSLPVEAYTTAHTTPASLATLFEKHTASLVRDQYSSQRDVPRPRHRKVKSPSQSGQPYTRPTSTTPVSQTPAALAAAGIQWEPWMGKEAPKTRRILNALLNPHAYTRTADACVQCTMDGVPCMLDLGVAPHEGIPCASCRGVRCTFKTQARRTASPSVANSLPASSSKLPAPAPVPIAATPAPAPAPVTIPVPAPVLPAPVPVPVPVPVPEVEELASTSSTSSTPPALSTSSSPARDLELRTPPTVYRTTPRVEPAPFLTPWALIPGQLAGQTSTLYQPLYPCVGCHASSQTCIIAANGTQDGQLPPCGCCSATGQQCVFVFAQEGWAYLSPVVMRGGQATWAEGCAGFPL